MRQGIPELRAFYASPLGRAAREMVARKITEAWGGCAGLDVLALGYATPFIGDLAAEARRAIAVMPAAQGVESWPFHERNRACLADEMALPLPNAMLDRILAVHALEESDGPLGLLREAARVLAPAGRMIIVVAARHGPWAHGESSPFGHGRSYSRIQLEAVVREAGLEPIGWTRALYAPPLNWAARWAGTFEQAGALAWAPFAGLVLLEAAKQTFAIRPKGRTARAAPRGVFQPVPAANARSSWPRPENAPTLVRPLSREGRDP